MLASALGLHSGISAQTFVPPTGTDQLWVTTTAGVINGINTALIDYPIAQQVYGQLAACAHGATMGTATPVNGVEVTDLTYNFSVSVPYPAGLYDMASVPDVILGNNMLAADPTKEFIMAVGFMNNNTPPDIEIDYFDVVFSTPGVFTVTYNSSEYLPYIPPFNIPLGTVHLDVVAQSGVTLFNRPQCDRFFITFDAPDGGSYDIFGGYGRLSLYSTTSGTVDVTDTFQTVDNWQPDVAGIQLKPGAVAYDAAIFTWVTQGNNRLHTMTWRPIPDVTLATSTYNPMSSPFALDYFAHPRIDANDDFNTNAGGGNSNYKVVTERLDLVSGYMTVETVDNLAVGVLTSGWIVVGSGTSNNYAPAVAFGPLNSQYMVTEVAQDVFTPADNYIIMEPFDMSTPGSIAPDPFTVLSYFQTNNTSGFAFPTDAATTNFTNAVSTACNHVSDTSLVSWADYDGFTGSYNIWYKRSGYDWGGTGHYYRTGQTSVRMPEKQEALIVRPNPAQDVLSLSVSGKYTIMNMLGQLLQQGDLYIGKHDIDISKLLPGNYIISFAKPGESTINRQFTKL